MATQTVYRNTNGTGPETTSYTYTWFSGTTQMQSETVTKPVISAAENGPGTADVTTTYFDTYGRPIWTKDAGGYLTYTACDPATSAVVESITDVNTNDPSEFTNLPSGWSTPSGGGLNLISLYNVDSQGRTTEAIDPDGNITYTVYDDPDQEVRTYPGWNSSTGLPTGPTQVTRENDAEGYTETLTMTATPHLTNGVPDGTEAISGLQSLSRSLINAAGQEVEEDDYFNLSGVTYSTTPYLGTVNVNYYATLYGYDQFGRQNRVQKPTGTIERTVYDDQGRVSSTWVGTNDTPASGGWSPTNPAGMVEVSSDVYDNGGVGDGNLTQETQYPGGSAAPEVTQYWYDWRDRQVASKSGVQASEDTTTHRPITYTTYDNLNEAIELQSYDGDGVTLTTTNGVPQPPSSSLLRSETITSFDDQGRVYQTQTYSVNPSTGAVSSTALTTNDYYDHRGDQVAESDPGGQWTKDVYDGAGRETVEYITNGANGTTWAEATSVGSDIVLEQTETTYDADGNVILTTTRERFHNETATGPLANATTSPHARVSYEAEYYDAAGREIASVNVGTNGGTAYTRPTSVPSPSNTVLVTSTTYNSAGLAASVTDPMGLVTMTYYDALGRTTKTIQDYTNGTPTNETNKTTEYTYDGDGNQLTVQADEPGGAFQRTQYVYGVSTSTGSTISSNDILAAVEYPDPTTGLPSTSSEETYTVNALGQNLTYTDRDGNVHTYTYDVLGRQTSDAVTTLGSGVDGSVRCIATAYDTQGNAYLVTSYNAPSGGTIVNQVENLYNGLDQLTAQYQSNNGAVNLSTTPVVQYAYNQMSGGANNSRLTNMTYPNGRVINYNYNSGLDSSISRLSSISDSTGILESYLYLGLDTVVERDHPQTGVNETYISQNGTTGDAGDMYIGLDRFGRIVDDNWFNTATGTSTDRFQYGYDPDGDVLWRNNLVNPAMGELYTYDGLNQLTSFQRGTLNSTDTGIVGTPSVSESWTYDALGNWLTVTTNGTEQTRTANQQNEITSISGQTTPAYDANGNMTTDQNGNTLVYDAWNRLVAYKSGSTTLESYQYDGLDRRIVQNSGTATDLYYSSNWQVLEERQNGTPTTQYVWSPVYVNAMVERDQSSGGGTLNERLYAQQDANWNVTALVSTSGTVVERYVYDPYGTVTVLSATWETQSGSNYTWVYLFQGGRWDSVTGDYKFQMRDYNAAQGRWTQPDPTGYGAGDTNLYRYTENNPLNNIDPSGLLKKHTDANGKTFFGISAFATDLNETSDIKIGNLRSLISGIGILLETNDIFKKTKCSSVSFLEIGGHGNPDLINLGPSPHPLPNLSGNAYWNNYNTTKTWDSNAICELDATYVGQQLKQFIKWSPNAVISLSGCNIGNLKGNNTWPQMLADSVGVKVIAPLGYLSGSISNNSAKVSSTAVVNGKKETMPARPYWDPSRDDLWRIFTPDVHVFEGACTGMISTFVSGLFQ